MAPSVAARGKIHRALRRGDPRIPEGWALDARGRPTTDPAAALAPGAVMLPAAGAKGSALAIMMDVFSGVLTGAAFAGDVVGPYDTTSSRPADVGHFLVAIRPDLFISLNDFRARMDVLYRRVVASEPADRVDRVYFPGEIELRTEARRRADGIPYVRAEIDALDAEADRLGVARIPVLV